LPSIAYPSPFEFETQSIVLAVRRGPDPRQAGWAETTAATLDALLNDPARKTMALFTSYRDLGKVADCLRMNASGLEAPRYHLLVQEPRSEPSALLDRFRKADRALLLGTATFWEGVDLPGDDLEVLVLTRLPFGVPTDPRFAARAERMEAEGGNAFTGLYLPEAVLRMKQGFGRLIRRRSDRGIVAVLDPRLLGKGYGRRFTSALPLPVTEVTDAEALVYEAAQWWRRTSEPA
jgi:ATP-dependent DNA helicase DinG